MMKQINWKRVILAAVGSEVGVILVLLTAITVYARLIAPPLSDAQYQELGQRMGYYIAPATGAVTTFLMAMWVGRHVASRHVANGLMVGIVGVILTVGFAATARPEDRLMYGVAFVLRIASGWLGGWAARQKFAARTSDAQRLAS